MPDAADVGEEEPAELRGPDPSTRARKTEIAVLDEEREVEVRVGVAPPLAQRAADDHAEDARIAPSGVDEAIEDRAG